MSKEMLVNRPSAANPGWAEWDSLIELVESLEFATISLEHLGRFVKSEDRLAFEIRGANEPFPDFVPSYVEALFGLKIGEAEVAGGFAEYLTGTLAKRGALFNPAGLDERMGFPVFEVPNDTYCFQSNSSGASFFINKNLEILYPNSERAQFSVLDPLDEFAKTCLRMAVLGENWFNAYATRATGLID